jgi:RNA polymerase sigma-70 factor (ECF subfamily)
VAVANLFEQHGRMVFGLCRAMLDSREEAEDAAQQTFLSAHRTLMRGESCYEPAAWLSTIARHECWRRLGRRRLEVVPLDDVEPSGGRSPDALLSEREELAALCRALTELPPAQREAIVLREFHGLSYNELASALGRSRRAVESLLFKSRRTLNARLRPSRETVGALVLPTALRGPVANLITRSSAAGAGGVAAIKVLGLPAVVKLGALLAAGAFGLGLNAERGPQGLPAADSDAAPRAQHGDIGAGQPTRSPSSPASREGSIADSRKRRWAGRRRRPVLRDPSRTVSAAAALSPPWLAAGQSGAQDGQEVAQGSSDESAGDSGTSSDGSVAQQYMPMSQDLRSGEPGAAAGQSIEASPDWTRESGSGEGKADDDEPAYGPADTQPAGESGHDGETDEGKTAGSDSGEHEND